MSRATQSSLLQAEATKKIQDIMLAPSSWEYQEVYEPYDGEYYLDYEAPKVLTEEAIMRIEEATRIIAISQETFRGGVFTTGNSETDKILNEIIKN